MGEINHLNIWHSFKQGNWDSYAALYNIYYEPLNNYGYKFTTDTELIEDAIHDLFVRLWTTRDRISNPASVKNYLYKSLRNILFRKLKNLGKARTVPVDADTMGFDVSYTTGFSGIENREMQETLKNIIGTLPPRQQEIIYLRFYEGLSYDEIADIMSITVSSAYKLLYKAIQGLQDSIGSSVLFSILFCLKPFPAIFFALKG